MKKDWSYDSALISKANVAADFIFLNIVYLICCIPIVTIGPANAAMAGCIFAFRKEEAAGVKEFLRLFLQNIKTFLLLWLGVLGLGVVVLFDAYLLFTKPAAAVLVFAVVLVVLLVFYAMILSHISLIHAKFECKFRFMIANSVLLSLAHPLRTLALLILELLPLALFLFWPEAFVFLTPAWLLCYFSLRSYAAVRIMEPVYAKLLAR